MVATKTEAKPLAKLATGTADSTKTFISTIGKTNLLNASQEIELSRLIQDLLYLEEIKSRLVSKLGREPESTEWMKAVDEIEGKTSTPQEFRFRIFKGRRAKERMVQANLRLVVSNAKKYINRGLPLDDLIQMGSMGLIRAAEKFDATRGYKFSTYATWWIRQAITRGIAEDSRTIKIPVHIYEEIPRIRKVQLEMREKMNRNPTTEELATRLEMTVEKLLFIKESTQFCLSLDAPIGQDDNNCSLGDLIEDGSRSVEEDAEQGLLREKIIAAISSLQDDRQRRVIELIYGMQDGKCYSQSEVAKKLGLKSTNQVRTIEKQALRTLKEVLK